MKRYTINSPIKYGGKVRKDGSVELPDDVAADLLASGHVSEATVTAMEAAAAAEEARVDAAAAERAKAEEAAAAAKAGAAKKPAGKKAK